LGKRPLEYPSLEFSIMEKDKIPFSFMGILLGTCRPGRYLESGWYLPEIGAPILHLSV